jgi:hypothetical protein
MALITLISFLLYGAFRWEFRNSDSETGDKHETMNWSDIVLLSLGAVCQQGACLCECFSSKCLLCNAASLIGICVVGSTLEARAISGRTISITLYIAVIFLYTSYSACIVALLQSTTDSIRTLEDLYHSGLTLGAVDVVYSHYFFSVMPVQQVLL